MDLDAVATFAIDLARAAGDLAVAERGGARVESKGAGADLVTHVDHAAERLIVAAIARRFPDHAILGEEGGEQGAGENAEFRWMIDPLDGTNNYVLGIDLYGVCITLLRGETPVVAVVHDSPRRRTFAAIAGRGAWVADVDASTKDVALGTSEPLARTTVSFTQGYAVGHDDARRNALFDALERSTKRVLRTWAPSFDWGLLATDRIGALVAYRNELWDLVGGALLATEAGAIMQTHDDGNLVVVGRPDTVAALAPIVESFTNDVGGRS